MWSWSRGPDHSCVTPWTGMFRDSRTSLTTLSEMPLPRFFTSSRTQRPSGSVKVRKLTPSFPSRERRELTAARNPSTVDWATNKFSPFSWAIRLLGQDACNQARIARVLLTPEMIMGALLKSSSAGTQALATMAGLLVILGSACYTLALSLSTEGIYTITTDIEQVLSHLITLHFYRNDGGQVNELWKAK